MRADPPATASLASGHRFASAPDGYQRRSGSAAELHRGVENAQFGRGSVPDPMPTYLFEFRFHDGRISSPIAYEWDDTAHPLNEGAPVELVFEEVATWKVVQKLPADGYAGWVVLEEIVPHQTYAVRLVQPDGTIGTDITFASPDGRFPEVDQVIPADEHGGTGRVTHVEPDADPPIRAELRG